MIITQNGLNTLEQKAFSEGISPYFLMEKAGKTISAHIKTDLSINDKIAVLCGTGNNGGDGYVIAEKLRKKYNVVVYSLGEPKTETAYKAKTNYKGLIADISTFQALENCIIDAVFGGGFTPPIPDSLKNIISFLKENKSKIFSIDIPSGLCHESTANNFVQVYKTYCIQALRPIHTEKRALCGKIIIIDIGLDLSEVSRNDIIAETTWDAPPECENAEAHKYQKGSVLILGGDS